MFLRIFNTNIFQLIFLPTLLVAQSISDIRCSISNFPRATVELLNLLKAFSAGGNKERECQWYSGTVELLKLLKGFSADDGNKEME